MCDDELRFCRDQTAMSNDLLYPPKQASYTYFGILSWTKTYKKKKQCTLLHWHRLARIWPTFPKSVERIFRIVHLIPLSPRSHLQRSFTQVYFRYYIFHSSQTTTTTYYTHTHKNMYITPDYSVARKLYCFVFIKCQYAMLQRDESLFANPR